MPIYSYECDECHHRFDLKQGYDAKPEQSCPKCGKVSPRQFHAVGVIYKGSGFYTTDYRKPNPAASPSDSSTGSGSDSSTGSGSEPSSSEKATD